MTTKNDTPTQPQDDAYHVEVNGKTYVIAFQQDCCTVMIDGVEHHVDIRPGAKPDRYSVLLDGKSVTLMAEESDEPGTYRAHAGGYDFDLEVQTAREAFMRKFIQGADGGKKVGKVKAPMPGLIVQANLNVGDAVEKDDGVMIMEAMKMENEIKSPITGTITAIHVAAGDAVEKNHVLFEVE